MGIATVYLLSDSLVNTQRQYQLAGHRAFLYLIDQPRIFVEMGIEDHVGLHVVQSQSQLLVLVILVEIA